LRQLSIGSSRVDQHVPAERYARGPVEGSIGFTRPRGRRSAEAPTGALNVILGNSERPQPTRLEQTNGDEQSLVWSNEQRSRVASSEHDQADRHDPDFDRCYSKWVAPRAPQPQLPHYFVPGNVFGLPMSAQPGNDAAAMHTHFQSQQQFQVHHHPLTLQSGGGSGSMISGAPFGTHGQLFAAHHLHHPGALHDPAQLQMSQSHSHQSVPQSGMGSVLSASHLSPGLNPFPYSSMWLPNVATANSEWRDSIQPTPSLVTNTTGADRQHRFTAGSGSSLLHAPPPAAYGLDSRVDFPSLSEAQSLAKQ
jgi:hypothetical protein